MIQSCLMLILTTAYGLSLLYQLTSPDMNLDPRMISILSALSTIKRQMLQELDRFMAICWDRIGVPPPDHERSQSDNSGGGGRGSNPLANILTPGRCVPVLIFVIERVPIIAPWHDAGASETQIVEVGFSDTARLPYMPYLPNQQPINLESFP